MKSEKCSSAGFTMIELLIAMVIATIMFTGIYLVSLQTMNLLQLAKDESRAIQAAQYEMEKLRSRTWMSLLTMAEDTTFDTGDNVALSFLRNGAGQIKRTNITPSGVTAVPLLAVSVTVSWDRFDGNRDSKTLTSAITKRGMLK